MRSEECFDTTWLKLCQSALLSVVSKNITSAKTNSTTLQRWMMTIQTDLPGTTLSIIIKQRTSRFVSFSWLTDWDVSHAPIKLDSHRQLLDHTLLKAFIFQNNSAPRSRYAYCWITIWIRCPPAVKAPVLWLKEDHAQLLYCSLIMVFKQETRVLSQAINRTMPQSE